MKNDTNRNALHALVFLCGLVAATGLVADQALSPYQEAQAEADAAYANGDYRDAYGQYVSLARRGDSFSQYRVSYMHFQGQGVERDMAEAFAWAVLAAQGNNPKLVQYLGALSRDVPEAEHKRAAVKAKHYLDRWGDLAIAEDARRGALRELRSCTGSRLGIRCEEVYSMQMPKFWDINHSHSPFIGQSDIVKGSTSYTTGNAAGGGEVRNTRYYLGLRSGIRDIEAYLAENAGNVTIGELETLEAGSGGDGSDR